MGSDFGKYNQYHGRTNFDNSIFDYLLAEFPVRTMVDVGCGPGGMVDLAVTKGINVLGIDGDPDIRNIYNRSNFEFHDYTEGGFDPGVRDLAWVFEFLEHVYEKYIPNFFTTLSQCKIVFATHSFPGQKGTHHVNNQETEYWIDVFEKYNFTHDTTRSKKLREIADCKFSRNSAMLFVNTGMLLGIKGDKYSG